MTCWDLADGGSFGLSRMAIGHWGTVTLGGGCRGGSGDCNNPLPLTGVTGDNRTDYPPIVAFNEGLGYVSSRNALGGY